MSSKTRPESESRFLIVLLGLPVALVLGDSPVAGAAADFDTLVRTAHQAREAHRLSDAAELYDQALALDGSWTEGWWYLGTINYEQDRHAQAAKAFRRLVELNESHGAAWIFLGLCEFQLGELHEAAQHLLKGRSIGVAGVREIALVADFHLALLYTKSGQFELAIKQLHKLGSLQLQNPALEQAMGMAALRLAFLPKELPEEKHGIAAEVGRAVLLDAQGKRDEARLEWARLIEKHSDIPNVHYAFGVFLVSKEPDTALEEFLRELEVSPDHVPARVQIALEYLQRGKASEGLSYAEEAVRMAPGLFVAHNVLGSLLLQLDQVERAVRELEEAVRLAPGSADSRHVLAQAYARAGRKEEAARERAEFQRLEELRRQQEMTQ